MTEKYKLSGISCSSCARTIEKELGKKEGVSEIYVNDVTSELNIKYDPAVINYNRIKKIIENLGYGMVTEKEKEKSTKIIYVLLIAAVVLYIAMGSMFGLYLPKIIDMDTNPNNFATVQFILSTIVVVFGFDFYNRGFKALFKKTPNMDSLVAIGTGASYLYSIFATYMIFMGDTMYIHHLYFETTAVIIALVMLGKYLETKSKEKTNEAVKKLLNLFPEIAIVEVNGEEVEKKIDELAIDDICIVKKGSKIPLDGVIVDGTGHLNESHITGESVPVKKNNSDFVIGGSILTNGFLKIKIVTLPENTVIAKIISLVEEASSKKANIAKLADKISLYFVPFIIILAISSSIFWFLMGENSLFILNVFVSILVIACPCALGLATPVAIITGTGKGAENGILIRSGEALELMHTANTIIFDKTGTITEGKPVVTDIINHSDFTDDKIIKLAASLEIKSDHPIAQTFVSESKQRNLELFDCNDFEIIDGLGVVGLVDEKNILIGNKKLMENNKVILPDIKIGGTLIYMSIDQKLSSVFLISDKIKETSYLAIEKLKKQKIEIVMLTGDNDIIAKQIATQVGIENVIANVMPEDKYLHVKEFQKKGKVIMVGDGINDAPALAQADVGISLGNATDIAIDSSDVILLNGDLNKVASSLLLSRKTIVNIKQNLFWAFIYNILGLPIAAGLIYLLGGPLLNPMFAGLAMAFSSISVVLNALRLKKIQI